MLGLSSSYFGFQGKGIYDSAGAVFGLGFGALELGAGHVFEKGIWESLARIKRDFPDKNFTVHGLFPPLEKRLWFNACLGLTKQNEKIVNNFFKAAQVVEASVVSIHPGFLSEVEWLPGRGGMCLPVPGGEISRERAWPTFFAVVEECLALAEETGCAFAVENLTNMTVQPLVFSIADFQRLFERFPELKLLLDVGHALYLGMLPEFLDAFNGRVGQLHLHLSMARKEQDVGDEHRPITSLQQLEPLKAVRQFKKIPVIFEHSLDVSQKQILAEKSIVEGFGEGL